MVLRNPHAAYNCHGAMIVSIMNLARIVMKIKAHICRTLKSILESTALDFLSVNVIVYSKQMCCQLSGITWKYFHPIYFSVSRQHMLTICEVLENSGVTDEKSKIMGYTNNGHFHTECLTNYELFSFTFSHLTCTTTQLRLRDTE